MLSIWPFSTPSSLFTIFPAPYVLSSSLLSLFQPLLTSLSTFPLSTFIFFSTIHFVLKHHYLNGLFLVFLLLLILNVKQSRIQDYNQHMRKNIQSLLFCSYVTSLNIIVSTFTHLPPYFISSIHPFFTEYSRDYIILYHFNFNNNICTKYLIIKLLQIMQCLMKHFCQFLHK